MCKKGQSSSRKSPFLTGCQQALSTLLAIFFSRHPWRRKSVRKCWQATRGRRGKKKREAELNKTYYICSVYRKWAWGSGVLGRVPVKGRVLVCVCVRAPCDTCVSACGMCTKTLCGGASTFLPPGKHLAPSRREFARLILGHKSH